MSLNGTAICFPNGTTDVCTLNGPKSTTPQIKGHDRLVHIIKWLDEFNYAGITHVCWEQYAFSRSGQVFNIGELGGILKLYFLSRGIPIIAVTPSTLKLFTTGKGNAKKEEMQEAILERWGYWYEDDNEADAYALMQYGRYWLKEVNAENSVETDALLDKVEYYGVTALLQTFAISLTRGLND